MRKLCVLLSVLFASFQGITQTTLINSTFEANDATVGAWSFAGDNPNVWVIDNAVAASGSRSAYISNNNGNTNQYAPGVSGVSHMYRSVSFPAGQGAILLSFDINGIGEPGTITYDYVRLSLTASAPVAGTMPSVAEQLPVFLSAYASFNRVWVAIPSSYAGTTRNLVFTFRTGNPGGSTAPALDNVRLTSAAVAPLSGTKTIKPSGGDYTSFSEAIATLNANGVSGTQALTFNVDAGTTFNETPTAITVTGATADITFQKAGAGANPKIIATGTGNNRTLSTGNITTNTDAVIALAGADHIVFDGIDFASANYESGKSAIEYGVYVYNTSATNGGAQNNTIRNAAFTLNRTNLDTRAILQDAAVTPTAATSANSNNKYYNLTVANTFAGIELQGAAAFPDLNTEVGTTACTVFNTIGIPGTPNDIGNGAAQTWGIRAVNQSGVKIFNNKISNVTTTGSGTNPSPMPVDGILVEDFVGTANEVYNNQITGIAVANGTSISSASGINLSHPTSGSHSIKVYNNFVSGITHGYNGAVTANRYIKGIFLSGTAGSTLQSYVVDFNSVRIDGSGSPNTSSAALEIATTSGPVNYIRNNILSNFTGAQGSAAKHYGIVSTAAVRTGGTGSVTSYNDLYIANSTGGYVAGGGSPFVDFATVATFQGNFAGAANNLSVNPAFAGTTDLHITATGLSSAADPLYLTNSPWVTKDIDCETRDAATDIGADENKLLVPIITCTVPVAPTALSFSGITAAAANGSFTAPAVPPTGYVIVRSTGTLSAGPVDATSYTVNSTIGNGTVVAVGTATNFSLTGLTANTAYTITVFPFNNTNCTGGPVYNPVQPLTGTFTTCPATPASPTAVGSSSTFQLSFTSSRAGGASAVTYNLEVAKDAAFTSPVTGSPFTFADTTTSQTVMTYTVTGLEGATHYYYRLKANGCNGNSVIGDVTTSCGPVGVPYLESFESITVANTLPVCMTASPLPAPGGKTQTFVAAATGTDPVLVARTGTKFAAVHYSPNSAGYFFSAPLQLTGGVAYKASVYYKANGVAWSNVGLKYGTAATVADMTGSIVTVANAAATSYTQITGTFTPAATGVYYVSFYAENIGIVPAPDYIAFDDFSVEAGSACTAPVPTGATAVTATGATLNWNAAVPAPASYEIFYSMSSTAPTGTTQPSLAGITGTSRAITGLAAATTYYVWVRSNCGSVSAWSSAVSFTTLCAPVTLPYTENFDGATTPNLPACTTREDVNGDGSTWTTGAAPVGYSGKVLQYIYNISNAANDWFYTTGLNLTAGTSYTLSFKYGNNSTIDVEKLKVAYGAAPTAAAMTGLLRDLPSVIGSTPATAVVTFTPASTGVYYIGFQAYSAANQNTLYLDDISVTAMSTLPPNDEATDAFTLTVGSGCVGAAYTNAGATKSANEVFPSCSGTGQAPVWFKFVATTTAVRVSTDVGSGNTLTDSKIALFSATNPANYGTFTILSCDEDNGSVLGSGNMSVLYATGLTVGNSYYVAVDQSSATSPSGTFCIAVDDLSAAMLSSNSQCAAPLQQAVGSNTAYTGQVPLVDGAGKLIALVKNTAGEAASSYTPAVVVSAVQRQAGGRYYLNRNFGMNNGSSKITNIQLFFLSAELASLNAMDGTTLGTLAITRQSGSACQTDFTTAAGISTPLQPVANGTIDGVLWIEAILPAGTSNLYLNKTGVVLPVNLLSFAGQRLGANNVLKWTVAQEQDVAAYQVERSENNRDWTIAGSVNSLGNASGQRSYSFTDNNVQGLKQYYRLRQVDRSGAAKLSNTIVISSARVAVLTLSGLFPNPAASNVNLMVEAPAKDNLTILIMDAVGKVVKTQKAFVEAGANTLSLKVAGLAQGSYLVKVTCEAGCETATGRFVKE